VPRSTPRKGFCHGGQSPAGEPRRSQREITTFPRSISNIGLVVFYVRESGFFGEAFQVQLMHSVALSPQAVERIDAGFLGGVRLRVLASRIGLNSAVTDHVGPAIEARHNRYDVDGIHVVAPQQCR